MIFDFLKEIRNRNKQNEDFYMKKIFMKRFQRVFTAWLEVIPELKKENFLIRKSQEKIVKKFRKVKNILLKFFFKEKTLEPILHKLVKLHIREEKSRKF